jgi:hypothetical protein
MKAAGPFGKLRPGRSLAQDGAPGFCLHYKQNSRSLHCAPFHPVDQDLSPGTPGFGAPVEMTIGFRAWLLRLRSPGFVTGCCCVAEMATLERR